MRIPYFSLVAAGALALGGCAYGDLGLGLGYGGGYSGYGGYYGAGYGGYGYGSPYYGYGGYGYGSPYFGWYDNYYYPGTGYYVYDRYRRPHVWNDRQRSHWTSRQQAYARSSGRHDYSTNWSGFPARAHTRIVNGVPTATWHESGRPN